MNTVESQNEFLEKLESSCTLMLNAIGIPMKYNRHIIRLCEIKIKDLFPSSEIQGPGAVPFGFHLGSCLIKNIDGAKWNFEDFIESSNIFDLRVKIESKEGLQYMYPMRSVINYIKDSERRLTSIYDTIIFSNEHTLEEIQAMETDKDGWISTKNGFMFRITKQQK